LSSSQTDCRPVACGVKETFVGCQPGVPFPVPRCLLHLQEGKQAAWNIVNFVPRLRTERARDVATASPKCPFRDPNLTQIAPVLHRRRGKQAARDIVNFVPKRVPNAFQNASKTGFLYPGFGPARVSLWRVRRRPGRPAPASGGGAWRCARRWRRACAEPRRSRDAREAPRPGGAPDGCVR
jgi:hypothetical protein